MATTPAETIALPPVVETGELVALQRALRSVEGFALYLVRVNSPIVREQIRAWLRANVGRELREVQLDPAHSFLDQLLRADRAAPREAILCAALEVLPGVELPDGLLRGLNWQRAACRRLTHPLLLWMP